MLNVSNLLGELSVLSSGNYQQIRNIIISSSLKIKSLKGKVLGGGKLDAARAMDVAEHVHNKLFSKGRKLARKTAGNKK